MIAELQQAVEDRVRHRNPEVLQYILTHPTDYYHTQVKPKLHVIRDLLYYQDEEIDLSYWSVMNHFLRIN